MRGAMQGALLRRELLEPIADRRGLDYDVESFSPGNRPDQIAFQLLACGADLLLGCTYANGFPSTNRRTCRRGAKAVVRGYPGEGGEVAARFLAQSLGALMVEVQRRAGHLAEA